MNRPLLDHLPAEDSERLPPEALSQSTVSEIAAWLVGQPLDAVEREMIRQTLEACNGDRALAASVLGISLPRLRKKLTAYAVRGEALDVPEPAGQARNVPPPPPAANDAGLTVVEDAPEAREAKTGEEESSAPVIPVTEVFTAEAGSTDPAAVDDVAFELMATGPIAQPPAETSASETIESFLPEVAEPVAFAPEAIERPKLIVAPPARQRRRAPGFGLFALLFLGVVALAMFGLRYLGADEVRIEAAVKQAPQLPGSLGEKQPFERRIPVPVWIAPPPLPAAPPVSIDIAADRRAKAPIAVVPQPRAIAMPAGGLASANIERDTHLESASALASANIELDTRMDPPSLLASSDIEHDTRMDPPGALASANIELDTHMDAPAATLAAANAGPEITGSIDADPPFLAPETAPLPPARAEPEAPPARPVQRQAARPQPAQPEQPQIGPLLFPFNLFVPREGREARGLTGPSGENAVRPECCGSGY